MSEILIKRELIRDIIRESVEQQVVEEGIFDFVSAQTIGRIGDKVLSKMPKSVGRYIRGEILEFLSRILEFDVDDGFGLLVKVFIENLSLEMMGEIKDGTIQCDQVVDLFVKSLGSWVTQYGVREILAYLLRNYDLGEIFQDVIDINAPSGFLSGSTKLLDVSDIGGLNSDQRKNMSRKQANAVIDSLIGSVSTRILNDAVIYLLEEYFIPDLAAATCKYFKSESKGAKLNQQTLSNIKDSEEFDVVKNTVNTISDELSS